MSRVATPTGHTARAERLGDARLYLCTDARQGRAKTLDLIRAAIDGGVDIVQLRDKELSTRDELALLTSTREICHRTGALFAVNDRADLAQLTGADVFHTGQDDLPIPAIRQLLGTDVLLGRSTHSPEQAQLAASDPDIDYFCIGPVWATPTKPGRPPVGLQAVAAVAKLMPTPPSGEPGTAARNKPWFAIGGIDQDLLPDVIAAGAVRVAVVRAIARATDPAHAARTLRDQLR